MRPQSREQYKRYQPSPDPKEREHHLSSPVKDALKRADDVLCHDPLTSLPCSGGGAVLLPHFWWMGNMGVTRGTWHVSTGIGIS